MTWEILDTGVRSAGENMALDAQLLADLGGRSRPVLHYYEWAGDSATYGHFIDPGKLLNLEGVSKRGLQLARRSTGGGIVFHLWDMAFSALVPASCPEFSHNTLENYNLINRAVLQAVQSFLDETALLIPKDLPSLDAACNSFCMAKPTIYDVVLNGKKIAGAAQRKMKQGFLHQGTISLLMPPPDYLKDVLLPDHRVLEAIEQSTHPLIDSAKDLPAAKVKLRSLLASTLNTLSLELTHESKT